MIVPPPNTKGWTYGWIATEPIPGTEGGLYSVSRYGDIGWRSLTRFDPCAGVVSSSPRPGTVKRSDDSLLSSVEGIRLAPDFILIDFWYKEFKHKQKR